MGSSATRPPATVQGGNKVSPPILSAHCTFQHHPSPSHCPNPPVLEAGPASQQGHSLPHIQAISKLRQPKGLQSCSKTPVACPPTSSARAPTGPANLPAGQPLLGVHEGGGLCSSWVA